MVRVAFELIRNYGAFGIGIVQLGLIGWFSWKLLTNHFYHLQKDVTAIMNAQKVTDEKLDKVSERVANLEGQLK